MTVATTAAAAKDEPARLTLTPARAEGRCVCEGCRACRGNVPMVRGVSPPYYDDGQAVFHHGDVLAVLREMPSESVHCVVTSPPYWGLRNYGVDGQIGLEATPAEYVERMTAVFADVRRVLRSDGTCWVNLGDSYAANRPYQATDSKHVDVGNTMAAKVPEGLKPKDLVGIPWRVAFALQAPQYTGRIRRETDRVWLAAMVDGEGCMFIHKRKTGQSNGQGYERKNDSYGAGLEVANTSEAVVRRCMDIAGAGSIFRHEKDRRQPLWRWNLRSNQCREVIREIYPHLVAKQHQARLLLGCPSSGENADAAHTSLMALHNGENATIDFPAPESMFGPGWYLRSDVIWSKANPMPESVTDRPTKAHEYLFLLTKSARYAYDADAIREPASENTLSRFAKGGAPRKPSAKRLAAIPGEVKSNATFVAPDYVENRNKRSVWTIATAPYPEAHFATFPPDLVKPCILAGCPEGGTVLDPFLGSGTTAMVAKALGRKAIGIDLSAEYLALAVKRCAQQGLFA